MRRVFVVCAVALLVAGGASAAKLNATDPGPVIHVPTLADTGHFDKAAFEQRQQDVLAWLESEQVVAGLDRPIAVELTKQELVDIESQHGVNGRLRVGLVKAINAGIDLLDLSYGAMSRTDDGGLVWSVALASPTAAGLAAHFTDFWLPEGFELYLYSEKGEVFGPYVGGGPFGDGEFWSNTVSGQNAVLQLRHYGPVSDEDLSSAYFKVADLGHIGWRFFLKAGSNLCSFNASCVENASCTNVGPAADAQYAIAHMRFVSGRYVYFCTGGLLNNTSGDHTPYFLTANHCLSRNKVARTLEAYFQFSTSCSNPQCPEYPDTPSTPRTLGASVLSSNKASDYTLMELSEPAPSGSRFLGWTNQAIAYSNGADLYRISHPGGAPQAFSHHTVDTGTGTCTSWPRGGWIYSHDVFGATEGGSSGSPVVNGAGEVVGQLSGGCGTNVNDVCDNTNNATVDGAFAGYYDSVKGWLDPGGCPDADSDGYTAASCGGTDCDDSDPNVNPGAAEVCGDGIDNNCNGTVDEGCGCADADGDGYTDAACGGSDCDDSNPFVNPGEAEVCGDGIDNNCDGTVDEGCGVCEPAGTLCSSNSECCSNKCKGKPGAKTCK